MTFIIILAFWGCASFGPHYYKLGVQAEMSKNWDEAIEHYEKALQESPREYAYKVALARAKFSASLSHVQEARRFAAKGDRDNALKAYEKALSYAPRDRAIAEEMRRFIQEQTPGEKPKPERIESPVKLRVPPEKIELKFTEASLRSIFQALAKHARVNILFDELFKDMPLTIDLSGKEFEEAVSFLCLASKNFYRVIDEQTLIIVPDQPVKRLQYEQNAIKVFYLSNLNAQDIFAALTQMLRTQYRAPNIIVDKNLNTVTVRDTPANIELAAELIRKWDKPKGEVIIDLEIMEVSRQKLREIGLDLDQVLAGIRYAGPGATDTEGWYNLGEIDLGAGTSYQISLPSALVRFLESDADTRILAQPRLRGVADEEIKTLVGQRVPIPQTTFTPIAAGGISQQPVTSFTFEEVGLDIKIKPRIHLEREVTLEIELKIRSIAGTGYANLPIISTREIKNTIRLKDGETNLLAGLLRDEERKTMRGIAGLKSIPVVGYLFAATDQTIEQSDVILTITPYIIRTVPHTAEDDKPVWIQLEGISGAGRVDRGLAEAMDLTSEQIMKKAREEEEMPEARRELAGENVVTLDPANFEIPRGREFRISVNIRSQQEMGSFSLNLGFNPQVVKLKDVLEGGFVRQLGEKIPFLKSVAEGSCVLGFSSPQPSRGFKGGGNLAILVFEAAAPGETSIAVTSITANAPTGTAINFTSRGSSVIVR
ncbi:MAG: tetratricopeptide repeat protein [Candidatus Aminicenantes bacterium]|nr:tetratricopeptide repeat protein [Candidatus Aminicenantes bacterium]